MMTMGWAQFVQRSVMSFVAALGLLVSGCVSDEPQRRPMSEPADLRADLVTIATYPLIDNDNNTYPDTIPIVVYLWDNRYPLPMWAEGTMHFVLEDEQNRVIAEWDVPTDVLITSRRRDQVGASHVLTLDIRDATTDVLPATNVRLSARYVGDDGKVARTARPLGLQIGA